MFLRFFNEPEYIIRFKNKSSIFRRKRDYRAVVLFVRVNRLFEKVQIIRHSSLLLPKKQANGKTFAHAARAGIPQGVYYGLKIS